MNVLATLGQRLTPKNVTLGVIMTNMVCRPTITLSNKKIPEDTRRYTATREFFTEFFGLITTFGFASAVEKYVPKMVAKKFFKTDLTKQLVETIKNTGWDKLSPLQKNMKGVILGSSFVATALAVAVLTPILNNLLLNKMIDKIMGKNKTGSAPAANKVDTFEKTPGATSVQNFTTGSSAFDMFLKQYNSIAPESPLNGSR